MRRFWTATRSEAVARDAAPAPAPAVRFVYDRPLPYARILRVDVLGPDGTVVSSTTKSFRPRQGWVTESVADCA